MGVRINGRDVVLSLISAINENKAWLSEIDGAIGDGDHGVNMAKGFNMAKEKVDDAGETLSEQLKSLGMILVSNIGGAMGPIYGTFFMRMAKPIEGKYEIDENDFKSMLESALEGVKKRGQAEVGDKTLVDTLEPATKAFAESVEKGLSFKEALDKMVETAKKGMESTKDLVAKKGRSSRLGDRSKGTIDAGAASCYIILKTLAESIEKTL
ncbi:MAG: dihydroxyacetone kinase subunit L [Spirochaetes bacterium]|nr:MAG: dihydroxyacetone kinase subunit L [Spirochaetota bacterium]